MEKECLILASQSPQRKKILMELGVNFSVLPAHIDEHHAGYKAPHAIVQSIAFRKASFIAASHPTAWVLGCDTIVVLKNGQIALKAESLSEARKIIQCYKNSSCRVYSGLCLINLEKKQTYLGFEKTTLHFSDFSTQEINDYLALGRWKDCSGALTIEEKMDWIKHVDGDYWNVVGLPVPTLKKFLQKADLV